MSADERPVAASFPGEGRLGRGVVVRAGDAATFANLCRTDTSVRWAKVESVTVGDKAVADLASIVATLARAWANRRRIVVHLGVDPKRWRAPETSSAEPWRLGGSWEPLGDRMYALLWANNYDLRRKEPVWWPGVRASRLGATIGGPADIILPDGTAAWCDGGPHAGLDLRHAGRSAVAIVHVETIARGSLSPTGTTAPRSDLAADQLRAVAHRGGPARIVAPAGSGKTRVLSERLRHLVVDRGIQASSVTAVAYNTKAADELRDRCSSFPGDRAEQLNIRTIHSLAMQIAFPGGVSVLKERDVRRIIESLVEVSFRANSDPIEAYVNALAQTRIGLIDPAAVERGRSDVPGFAAMFPRYRAQLREKRATDFDDMVYSAIELLSSSGATRTMVRALADHMLIDEYQDLTPSYLLLLRLAGGPTHQVFAVGDDDQCIYGYAGADPAYLIDFESLFPGASEYALEVNYRCPAPVVAAASSVLAHNTRRVDKVVRPDPTAAVGEDRLRVVEAVDLAVALGEVVAGFLSSGTPPEQVAVLARVNSALLPAQAGLHAAGIPCRSALGPEVLERSGIRSALLWLRVASDPGRMAGADLAAIARRPARGLDNVAVEKLSGRGHWDAASLLHLAGAVGGSNARDGAALAGLAADISSTASELARGGVPGALRHVRRIVGLDIDMAKLDSSKAGRDGTTHTGDLDALVSVASAHPAYKGFAAWLAAVVESGKGSTGVELSSVHRVKGREWDDVVVFGVEVGLFPHRRAEELEEERRVFHVALTRGRHNVVVMAAAGRASHFVSELDPAYVAPGPPMSQTRTRRPTASSPRGRGSPRSSGGRGTVPITTPRTEAKAKATAVVTAEVGLAVVLSGGFAGEISQLRSNDVLVLTTKGAKMSARYGETVMVAGRRVTLLRA